MFRLRFVYLSRQFVYSLNAIFIWILSKESKSWFKLICFDFSWLAIYHCWLMALESKISFWKDLSFFLFDKNIIAWQQDNLYLAEEKLAKFSHKQTMELNTWTKQFPKILVESDSKRNFNLIFFGIGSKPSQCNEIFTSSFQQNCSVPPWCWVVKTIIYNNHHMLVKWY